MKQLTVLSVASEIYPLIKTGGLADVAGSLPLALRSRGVAVRTLVPGYPAVMNALENSKPLLDLQIFGEPVRLFSGHHGALELFVLDAPRFFARHGSPYLSPDGTDWPDNGVRFAALAQMATRIALGATADFLPDIVHLHDWQTALTPAYLHYSGQPKRPGTVVTIHNLAYQGRFPRNILNEIGLPPESFSINGVEYYGDVGFLKAGLQFADQITTVSPTYANEIQQDDQGMGLAGLLRARSDQLHGILNGVDVDVWNPATDPLISRFAANELNGRGSNKAVLQERFNLKRNENAFLLGVISRLSWQKGLDILIECIPTILDQDMQLVLLGTGEAELEQRFRQASEKNPGCVGVKIGYDEELAHLIQAGSDALVVPSRFEPCGLTQLCALRYGAVPIVSSVGGLEDTVVDDDGSSGDCATGFKFKPADSNNLRDALSRARQVFSDQPRWRRIQARGMAADVSWQARADQYVQLYQQIANDRSCRA